MDGSDDAWRLIESSSGWRLRFMGPGTALMFTSGEKLRSPSILSRTVGVTSVLCESASDFSFSISTSRIIASSAFPKE